MMSDQKNNILRRTRALLLLKEPYEMTYWKEKLNSPLHRFQVALKKWWQQLTGHPAPAGNA